MHKTSPEIRKIIYLLIFNESPGLVSGLTFHMTRQADLAGVGYGIFLMDLEKAKEILP